MGPGDIFQMPAGTPVWERRHNKVWTPPTFDRLQSDRHQHHPDHEHHYHQQHYHNVITIIFIVISHPLTEDLVSIVKRSL